MQRERRKYAEDSCILQALLEGAAIHDFVSFVHLEEIKKYIKILSPLRSKMSPEITSNNSRLLIFQV